MGSYSPKEVQDLKNQLGASVRKIQELYGVNDRLMEMLRDKATRAGEDRRYISDLEERGKEKTQTIRSLKRRISKTTKEIIIE